MLSHCEALTYMWNNNIKLFSIMSNLQTRYHFKLDFQKVDLQYIPRNMHTVFALLCFVVVIHWLIYPYPSGLLYWHCGNLTIAPVPAKQPWWIWINTSFEFIMNDYKTITKQSTTKPCAYFLGYTVHTLGKWLLHDPKRHKDNQLQSLELSCILVGNTNMT